MGQATPDQKRRRLPSAPYQLRDGLLATLLTLPYSLAEIESPVNPQRAYAVLSAICNRASAQRGIWSAWPSWDKVREDVGGMGKNQLAAILRALQDVGYLRRYYRGRVPCFEICGLATTAAGEGGMAKKAGPTFHQKRESTFPVSGNPIEEQAVSEQNNTTKPDGVIQTEVVIQKAVEVARREESKTAPAETKATPVKREPKNHKPTEFKHEEQPGNCLGQGKQEEQRLVRAFPYLIGLLPAIFSLAKKTGRDRAAILAAVEHCRSDVKNPPADPLKAACWRAENVKDQRMKALLRKAQIALGMPPEIDVSLKRTNDLLFAMAQSQSQAIPVSLGLSLLRANCKLLGGHSGEIS